MSIRGAYSTDNGALLAQHGWCRVEAGGGRLLSASSPGALPEAPGFDDFLAAEGLQRQQLPDPL